MCIANICMIKVKPSSSPSIETQRSILCCLEVISFALKKQRHAAFHYDIVEVKYILKRVSNVNHLQNQPRTQALSAMRGIEERAWVRGCFKTGSVLYISCFLLAAQCWPLLDT